MELKYITSTNKYYLHFDILDNKGRYKKDFLSLTKIQGEKIKKLKVVFDILQYIEKEGLIKGLRNKHSIK